MKRRASVLEAENEKFNVEVEGLKKEKVENSCEMDSSVKAKKDGKTFTYNYRKAAYSCLVNQVSVESTGSLIRKIVWEMTGKEVDTVADPTTISQMAYELSVLDDIHVGRHWWKEVM